MKVVKDGPHYDAVLEPELPADRLLPCPFCGAENLARLQHTWTACYSVKCLGEDCGAEAHGDSAGNLRARGRRLFGRKRDLDFYPPAHVAAAYDAVRRWNRRAKGAADVV